MFSVPVLCTGGERRTVSGYTLIEVIVAMAILSAMLLLGGMALNQGLKQYQGLVDKGLCFWDYAQNIWTEKSFHSIIDYYVHTDAQGWFPYFRGNQEGVSFVTLAPFAGDNPVAVWIRKEDTEGGKQKLVYHELPVYAKSYRELEDDFSSGAYRKGKSVEILGDADKIQFGFYGYNVRDREHKWRQIFEGAETLQLPLLVRIDYMKDNGKKMFMYAIHVNSQIKRGYETQYAQ
ncbi:MAG: prepilin-type N-terminal cleavage/methylation domain-containing protein [Smithella sp.]|nr:prepilin-type N-terminal cleavage/methylation domain-containing protein [Smithella sp.]